MSALPPKADIRVTHRHVCFGLTKALLQPDEDRSGSKAAFSVRLLNVCFHQQRTLADAQLIPVEVRPHVGAAVPGLVILLIPRKRLGPLKGRLAVNRIGI